MSIIDESLESNTGIADDDDDDDPNDSLRWHMHKDGRTFIMYGPQLEVLNRAVAGGYSDVTESGYYSYATNTIENPKDGPTSFIDMRKSGRLYG